MRKYLHIYLDERRVKEEAQAGETMVKAGRYLIAKTLVESDDKNAEGLKVVSLESQITSVAGDSLGLCVFGRNITTYR